MRKPEKSENEEASALPGPEPAAVGVEKWRKLLTICATLLALMAICGVGLLVGRAIHHTLLLFALGGLVAYALEPLVARLRNMRFGKSQRQLGKTSSVLLVYLGLFAACSGVFWWLGDQAAHQIKVLQTDAPAYRERAFALARDLDDKILRPKGIDFSVEDTLRRPPKEASVYAEKFSRQALPILAHTVSNLIESTIVLLIALYLLIFATEMKERTNAALSPFLRRYAIPWETDVHRIIGGFVRGQIAIAFINGACTAVGLLLLGVHLWLIIGAIVVVASLIPVFGTYIGAVPAVLAALVGPTHLTPVAGAIAVVILFIVITEVSGKILYPKMVGQALNLHEVVVLFVLFAGIEVGGIVGALFAAPVAALAIVTLIHLYRMWQELPEEPIADQLLRPESPGGAGTRAFKRARARSE